MKYFKILAIVVATLISGFVYGANPLPGSQFTYVGNGIIESSLGYTGVGSMGGIEGIGLNPAKAGDLRRGAFSFSILGLDSPYTMGNIGVSIPTLVGVFTFNGLYQNGPQSSDALGQLIGFDVAISKPISQTLFWGFALKFDYGTGLSTFESDWHLAFDMGFVKTNPILNKKYGVGFLDFAYGASLRNIGKTIKLGTYDPLPGMAVGLGISFNLMKFKMYQMKWLVDVNVPFTPIDFVGGMGMENTLFNILKIRGGISYNSVGMGLWYVGGGLKFSFQPVADNPDSKTDVEIAYSLNNADFLGVNELVHSLSLNVAVGYYDSKKPQVNIEPNLTHFSPNFDGSQDEIKLSLGVKDNTMVNGWEVKIKNKAGKTIKTIKSSESLKVRNVNIKKFFKQIFSKKKEVYIPEHIVWDGQDIDGKKVDDGEYFYILMAWDENKNIAESEAGAIIVDTVIPEVKVHTEYVLFSPNNDASKDKITFTLSNQNINIDDKIIAEVKNSDGVVVRIYEYTSKSPDTIVWDGKDNNAKPVGEGIYRFTVVAEDVAGNKTENSIAKIRLVTNYQMINLDVDTKAFSPNGDGNIDSIVFSPKLSDSEGLTRWIMRIYDDKRNTVKKFEGTSELPEQIIWDGIGDKGNKLDDGDYLYDVQLFFDSGNYPRSVKKKIVLDTTPTKVNVSTKYLEFSPNRDGVKDTITFEFKLDGDSNDIVTIKVIEDTTKNIIYYDKSKLGELEKGYTWDGWDRRTQPPYRNFPQGNYLFVVETTDDVGNKNTIETKFFLKTGRDKASINSDVIAISPDVKNANNKVVFAPKLSSTDRIASFTVEIRNSDNKAVRVFEDTKYIDKIEWDGKDDKGKKLPDGLYSYDLKVKYTYGDEPQSDTRTIRIDRVPPKVEIKAADEVFSPNNDGSKEFITIELGVEGNKNDVYMGAFVTVKDDKGKTVRQYCWKGDQVPDKVMWDGRDDKGRLLPEGVYRFELTGEDSAKNTTKKTVDNIRLVRSYETMKFVKKTDIRFSPNDDGNLETIKFTSFVSNTSQFSLLKNAELIIKDFQGKEIRRVKKGDDDILEWDGKDHNGEVAPDGMYTAEMIYCFDSGNKISETISGIVLDKTPPGKKLTVLPKLFTPDGDKVNDILNIKLELFDPNKLEYKMSIYKKVDGWEKSKAFKTFYSGDPTALVNKSFEWDGRGDNNLLVESVQDYILVVDAIDGLGNKLHLEENIVVGVLLIERQYDWIIRVNSINFETGKYALASGSKQVVRKVAKIIEQVVKDPKKYKLSDNYSIEISGHTDIIGSKKYNLTLSENRAKSVMVYLKKFLQKQKVKFDYDRLTSKGYAFDQQLERVADENDNNYNARNRRVEFIIKK